MSAVRDAATLVVGLIGQPELALVESGGDHDRARGMLLALCGLDRPWAAARQACGLAEADLDAGDSGVVGHAGSHVGAVPDLLEVVQFAEIDQRSARRQLVEAERLQSGTGGVGGGGEAGWPGADDDDVVRGGVHCRTNRYSRHRTQAA